MNLKDLLEANPELAKMPLEQVIELANKASVGGEKSEFKRNDEYWFIEDKGNVFSAICTNRTTDKDRIKCGNAFYTEEDAKQEQELREIKTKIFKYATRLCDVEFDKNGKLLQPARKLKITDMCGHPLNQLESYDCFEIYDFIEGLYFETEMQREKCIKEVGEENIIKYLMNR